MLKKLKKTNQGFTIIEVMIVLAIAALILLIVLLAVPALQRNSRNTAIKNDASAITAGISEFLSNNDGAIPTAAGSSQSGSSLTINSASGTSSTAKVQSSTSVHFESNATPTAANYAVSNIDVDYGYKCNSSSGAAVTANSRSTAVIYSVEQASGSAVKCVDS